MNCPICGNDTKVVETRISDNGSSIRRRRECVSCGKRFTTYEKFEDMPLVVIKKDGRKELFDGSKILKGLVKACEKRPIGIDRLKEFVEEVERELKNNYTEVPSEIIGQTVMDKLILMEQVFLMQRLRCRYGREECKKDTRVYSKTETGRCGI